MNNKNINIAVVAHVDHGKSTLCDAIIEYCENIKINKKSPSLDSHEIEKMRGVTIRNHFIKLYYKNISINLIDTPGHYDFARYVSVSINSADMVLLVIDVTKGIQPQTVAYMNLCIQNKSKIIIVLNKIDAVYVDIEAVVCTVTSYFGKQEIVLISAICRTNIDILLEKIYCLTVSQTNYISICNIEKCMYVLDCVCDNAGYTKILVQLKNKVVTRNSHFSFKNKNYKINKIYTKEFKGYKELYSVDNDICYIYVNISIALLNNLIGCLMYNSTIISKCIDKIHTAYTGLLSPNNEDEKLKKAIDKIALGDPGVEVHKRFSALYGNVFVCGFLGDFHKEIFLERLLLEENIKFATCYIIPPYRYKDSNNYVVIDYKDKVLSINFRKYLQNVVTPFITIHIMFRQEYYNKVYTALSENTYNTIISNKFIVDQFTIVASIPFTLLLLGFCSKLKSITNGYADFIISNIENFNKQLSLIEFFINGELIEEFSVIELDKLAETVALSTLERIRSSLERQQFIVKLLIKINRKSFKSCIIKPFRKDVTAKLYGGDSTRRKKLLNKQKEGKSKMLKFANISNVKKKIIRHIIDSSIISK